MFLIDWSKLGHSFSTNHKCGIYTINTKSSKPNSNSLKDEKSWAKYEEIDPYPSFKVDLPHIQSSQSLDLVSRSNKCVRYKDCLSPNVETSLSKMSKTSTGKLLKIKKKSIKGRLTRALLCKSKKIRTDSMIKRTKLKEMEN